MMVAPLCRVSASKRYWQHLCARWDLLAQADLRLQPCLDYPQRVGYDLGGQPGARCRRQVDARGRPLACTSTTLDGVKPYIFRQPDPAWG